MFLIEGLPSVLLGVVTFFYLKSGPEEAPWLTEAERNWLNGELAKDEEAAPGRQHSSPGAFLVDLRLWAMVATYFFWAMSGYALVFWLPLMVANFTTMTPFQVGLVSALPFLCAIAGLILMGRRTDRTGERKWSIISFAVLTALALLGSAYSPNPWMGFALLCVAAFFIWGQQAVFWTLPSTYLGGVSAAAGIALVNTGAALGGFVGPPAIGFIRQATGSYQLALLAISATSLVVAIIVGAMKIERLEPKTALGPG
jgi:nitrate/nitrite transporter NarK